MNFGVAGWVELVASLQLLNRGGVDAAPGYQVALRLDPTKLAAGLQPLVESINLI